MNFWSRTSSKTFNVFELVRLQKFIFYLFTALVLPLSTLIADEVFILSTYSYIYITLVKRYTVIIWSRYAVLQLVLLRSSEKYFYRYPRNMSIARIFHFALIVVTVRGKYQNILLLLRVYNLRVCFCSTNKIQLVLFQNIDHFKKLSSQEEPVYRESRAKTRLKTAACC